MSIRKTSFTRGGGPFFVRPSGCTLGEVLGVVAGMLVPNLTGTGGGVRLDAAARRSASVLDDCHQSALATGKVHGMVFDADGRRFQVVREDPGVDAGDLPTDAPPTLTRVSLPGVLDPELPEGVKISSVSAFDSSLISGGEAGGDGSDGGSGGDGIRILFFPDGTTEFATLQLTGPDGDGRRIELNGLSGDVSIESLGRQEIEEAGQNGDNADSGQEGPGL